MRRYLGCLIAVLVFLLLGDCPPVSAGVTAAPHGVATNTASTGHGQHSNEGSGHRRSHSGASTSFNHRKDKPERNRFEENRGKRSCGSRKQKRASRKKVKQSNRCNAKKTNQKGKRKTTEGDILKPSHGKTNNKSTEIKSERVDDIPLLLSMMESIGLHKTLDNHIDKHWKQRDLSWGWTALVWLGYILSEGDHRKVAVQDYVAGMQNTIMSITGQKVNELDFTDDRLTNLLKYLKDEDRWHKIEKELNENTIEAYRLPTKTIRCDATTVSGYHEAVQGGIFQFGNSKDDPTLPQIKIMTGSLDPLGMPLATDVVPGNRADDGLYIPVIKRIQKVLNEAGILYVGDCKLGSFDNRLHIRAKKDHYLCPLPNTGETAANLPGWIEKGILLDKEEQLLQFKDKDSRGIEVVKAKGYETTRELKGTLDGKKISWTERVMVANSPIHAKAQERGLEGRISKAQKEIRALTPERGRGKRQITDESQLLEKTEAILKRYRVKDLLHVSYFNEVEEQERYVGRGRGSEHREKQTTERTRYVITDVSRIEDNIGREIKRFGWKVYVTSTPKNELSFAEAMCSYRKEYRVERIFQRLKSRLEISPLFVKRDDQAIGMTHLLTLGVRVITLTEYLVRKSLQESNEQLVGLYKENTKKATDTPTYERIMRAFSHITLTIIESSGCTTRHVTPLSNLQEAIISRLGLDASIYTRLGIQQTHRLLSES